MIGIQNETNKYCIYFYSFIIINKFINLFILLNLYKIRILIINFIKKFKFISKIKNFNFKIILKKKFSYKKNIFFLIKG